MISRVSGPFQWVGDRPRWRNAAGMIEKLFKRMDCDATEALEFDHPYAYSERSLVGRLARSGALLGYHTVQDYDVNARESSSGIFRRFRPDLYVERRNPHRANCLFEAKRNPLDMEADTGTVTRSIRQGLNDSRKQILGYSEEKANHYAGVAILQIWTPRGNTLRKCIKEKSLQQWYEDFSDHHIIPALDELFSNEVPGNLRPSFIYSWRLPDDFLAAYRAGKNVVVATFWVGWLQTHTQITAQRQLNVAEPDTLASAKV